MLLELAPQFQTDPAALSLLYFKATPQQGGGPTADGSDRGGGGGHGAHAATARRRAGAGGQRTSAGTVVPLDTLAHDDAGGRPADRQPLTASCRR